MTDYVILEKAPLVSAGGAVQKHHSRVRRMHVVRRDHRTRFDAINAIAVEIRHYSCYSPFGETGPRLVFLAQFEVHPLSNNSYHRCVLIIIEKFGNSGFAQKYLEMTWMPIVMD